MIRDILQKIKLNLAKKFANIKWALYFLAIIIILVPASLFLIYFMQVTTQYVWMGNISSTFVVTFFLLIVVIILFSLIIEVVFSIFYYLLNEKAFRPSERVDFKKIYVEANPYLSYKFKAKFKNEKSSIADYPLHKGKLTFGNYTTNNMGYLSGPDGQRDVLILKPKDLFRINCLGASTTGNYIKRDNKNYSYPNELEKILLKQAKENIEVNNFGVGGYNSADILINFALNVIETKPDTIILYHAYNDIDAYLTPDLMTDYSHSRKNLAESIWMYKFVQKIPVFRLNFINYLIEFWLPVVPRNSLIKNVTKGKRDLTINPKDGLSLYKRNIQSLIDIAKANNIEIILSSFCHYLHSEIKDSKLHNRFHEIVQLENIIIENLAQTNKLTFVDNAHLIPHEDKYFVDSIHFSPEGMKLLARNFADAIIEK